MALMRPQLLLLLLLLGTGRRVCLWGTRQRQSSSTVLAFSSTTGTRTTTQSFFYRHEQTIISNRRYSLRRLHARVISDELPSSSASSDDEMDVIVIGSGLAGLACAALLSFCGKKTVVFESHDAPGGAAHTWERRGFHFESGPSLYSGLSVDASPNPLKNIFQIVDEDCEWITYDRWGTVLPNGDKFAAKIGPEEFNDVLRQQGGEEAVLEFAALMERMTPLSNAAQALTSLALREDAGAIFTLLKYPRELFTTLRMGSALNEPFGKIMDELPIRNKFVRNWLDMLCFLLQGLPAAGTMNAVMAYMLADWYRPGVTLDYPRGGSGAIVATLVRAIRKYGGRVCLNAHVEEILVEDGRACGVRLRSTRGRRSSSSSSDDDDNDNVDYDDDSNNNNDDMAVTIRSKQAVVSNADPYVTNRLLAKAELSDEMRRHLDQLIATDPAQGGIPDLKSFIHLHAGIDATGLPATASADFPAQWAVIKDWDLPDGVEAPRNIVLCSMPSLIDPTLAPPGKHVLHAYVPATEPYEWWAGLDRTSVEYQQKKEEAAEFLWRAVEQYVPQARDRAVPGTVQIGTPLTHERFLRRTRGTYG
jgi:phytoene dehydrogenase-like protein